MTETIVPVLLAHLATLVYCSWIFQPCDARMTPNDPKLSDGGAWRGACPTVARTTDAQM